MNACGGDLRSKRNYAMLELLVGCGLRRGELLALSMRSVQLREEHWVIADSHGKAGHIRTVPIPVWVKEAIDGWSLASGITDGRIFRSINKAGKIWGDGMTTKVIWEIGKQAARAAGIEKLAPMTFVGRAPGYATSPVANSTRFNSCSGMSPFRRLNAIWAPNRSSVWRSMKAWPRTIAIQRVQGTDYPSLADEGGFTWIKAFVTIAARCL